MRDFTLLVGPNNEGKSNLLRALVTALGQLAPFSTGSSTLRNRLSGADYDWDRDYPQQLQKRAPTGQSEFTMEFELDPSDKARFHQVVGINLSAPLRVKLGIGPRNSSTFRVFIQGPSAKKLTARKLEIGRFLAQTIDIVYVATQRTASRSQEIVERLVARSLESLSADPAYVAALAEVRKLEQPLLDSMGRRLTLTLKPFIQDVRSVTLRSRPDRTHTRRDDIEIFVDDGTNTGLVTKGDGIQSLAALAVIRDSRQSGSVHSLVLAIEEPEAHLHPEAIRGLRDILLDVAQTNQVIATTHSPLMVSRQAVESAVIVTDSRATPASRLSEIRDALGVRISDNLMSADLVLVVEGADDREFLGEWLSTNSPAVKRALSEGLLGIDMLGGGSNLAYKSGLLKTSLCDVHAFVDYDDTGKGAVKIAKSSGTLLDNEVQYATCPGRKDSELEDLFDADVYAPALQAQFGIDVRTSAAFVKGPKKWSTRLEDSFHLAGLAWDADIELIAKTVTHKAVMQRVRSAVRPSHVGPLKALADRLAERLKARP